MKKKNIPENEKKLPVSVDEKAALKAVEEKEASEADNKKSAPKTVEEKAAPEAENKKSAPKAVEEKEAPEADNKKAALKAAEEKTARKPKNSRKHTALSAAFTAVFVAAVVVLNIIIGVLTDRFGLRADLTAQGLYTLSKLTENYLDNFLNTDIVITVTSPEKHFEDGGDYFKQVNEILKKISAKTSRITLDYLALEQNPDFAAKFSEQLAENYVVVENKNSGRYRIITPEDYFGLDDETAMYYYYYYGYISNSLIEQEAVSAMLYVSDDDPAKVVFTEGFGEHGSDALEKMLDKNGYEVEKANLLTGEIPEDADVVVVYAPSTDYDARALSKLDKFLDNGGELGKNVFYFASSDQPKTPNIDGFLGDWGMSVGYSVIGHTNPEYLLYSQTNYIHLQVAEDTEFTAEVYENGYIIGSDLRPVFIEAGTANELCVLMRSYENAFLYPLDESEDFNLSSAQTGTFNDVVMSSKTVSQNTSRVCVTGSEAIVGNALMSYTNTQNGAFFLEVFDSVCGKNRGVSITPKSFQAVGFEMTAATANVFAIVLCIVIPVGITALGVVVFLRRRHR